MARQELCNKIEQQRTAERLAKQNQAEKNRRRNRPRPKGLKERILKTKHHRSQVKKLRQRSRRSADDV